MTQRHTTGVVTLGRRGIALLAFCVALFLCPHTISVQLHAQGATLGLIHYDNRFVEQGYTLFAPIGSTTTFLIDNCGREIHSWPSAYVPGLSVYLLEDGSIVRAGQYPNPVFMSLGGYGGIIERISWDGQVLWSYKLSSSVDVQHHDVLPMPNGNVLAIAVDRRTQEEALAMGRAQLSAKELWSEKIVEIHPTGPTSGEVVWEWRLWDHLIQDVDSTLPHYASIQLHPELLDINAGQDLPAQSDWIHLNSVDYNAERDEILLSSHHLSEVWVIDHSTTTAEAAGHTGGKRQRGGDFLYRWGNPQNYKNGSAEDQYFGNQHNAHWIRNGLEDAGKIMVFNNNAWKTGPVKKFSAIDVFAAPLNTDGSYQHDSLRFGPVAASWRYTASPADSFYASFISGCQRLPNGNTLICNGPSGTFFEVDSKGTELWRYVNPISSNGALKQGSTAINNSCFRCTRYPVDHPAFLSHSLTVGPALEQNPLPSHCATIAGVENPAYEPSGLSISVDNPVCRAGSAVRIGTSHTSQHLIVRAFTVDGRFVSTLLDASLDTELSLPLQDLGASGCYVLELSSLSATDKVSNQAPVRCTILFLR